MQQLTVLDFGGQYAHLIANRIRRLGVLCTVTQPEDFSPDANPDLAGLILSGGPQSVSDELVDRLRGPVSSFPGPVLGICFGHQLLCRLYGGELVRGSEREYGAVPLAAAPDSRLFALTPPSQTVWMSHGDHVERVPPGFRIVGSTASCPVAAVEDDLHARYAVQFHPEVVHTEQGEQILRNFLTRCAVSELWEGGRIARDIVEATRRAAGDADLFLLLSGGVDSLVSLAVAIAAVGADRVHSLHVDTGLMRKGESDAVLSALAAQGFRNIECIRAESVFLQALRGVTEPEQKRAIIGRLFVEVLRRHLRESPFPLDRCKLVQGTIYPDTIESGGTKHAAKIKTHHNRVPEIQAMMERGEVVEPLRDLYKDEVRALGSSLGLPRDLLARHPFPGPGLGIRVVCFDPAAPLPPPPPEPPAALAEEAASLGFSAKILPLRSVGVQGDGRTYRHPLALTPLPGMTAGSWKELVQFAARAVNTSEAINRVLVRTSSEPLRLKPTFLEKPVLDRLREVDAAVSSALAGEADVWQAPVVALPLFTPRGEQAYVLRAVTSRDAMTADVFALGLDRLRDIARALKGIEGAGPLFCDLTRKPPATIEFE